MKTKLANVPKNKLIETIEKIKQQNRLNNNLKIQINMQSIEYENKIQKMTKLNEEENKKNKEKIQNLNESIR